VAEKMIDEVRPEKPKQPLGDFDTRCDDKGRIRLPSDWLHFFEHGLNDKKVFTTSLEGSVIRIYPESIWRANLSLFEELSDQSEDVERILTLANHYGTESDIDSSGRVLIKSTLRSELALLGDVVVGSGKKNVIHLQKKSDHEAIILNLKPVAPGAVKNLTRLGMK
jgi:DNA-binding transcriptional regulator/RsmH inhibitor MraZ